MTEQQLKRVIDAYDQNFTLLQKQVKELQEQVKSLQKQVDERSKLVGF